MALIEILSHRTCGNHRYYVKIATAGKERPQTGFSLSAEAMKDLRWVIGDRVKILLDSESNEVRLRRTASGGFSLNSSSSLAKNVRGKAVLCSMRTSDARLPRVMTTFLHRKDCYITDDGDLVFVYPVPFCLEKMK